jgi:hypothetical protein
MSSPRELRSKTQDIKLLEILDRTDYYTQSYLIKGTTGNTYIVSIKDEPTCTCPDFEHHKERCKHILYVLSQILRATDINKQKYSEIDLEFMWLAAPKGNMNPYNAQKVQENKFLFKLPEQSNVPKVEENKDFNKFIFKLPQPSDAEILREYGVVPGKTREDPVHRPREVSFHSAHDMRIDAPNGSETVGDGAPDGLFNDCAMRLLEELQTDWFDDTLLDKLKDRHPDPTLLGPTRKFKKREDDDFDRFGPPMEVEEDWFDVEPSYKYKNKIMKTPITPITTSVAHSEKWNSGHPNKNNSFQQFANNDFSIKELQKTIADLGLENIGQTNKIKELTNAVVDLQEQNGKLQKNETKTINIITDLQETIRNMLESQNMVNTEKRITELEEHNKHMQVEISMMSNTIKDFLEIMESMSLRENDSKNKYEEHIRRLNKQLANAKDDFITGVI